MAHAVRFAITLLAIIGAALVFMSWYSPWAWPAAIAVLVIGGGLAELTYRRLATRRAVLRRPPRSIE